MKGWLGVVAMSWGLAGTAALAAEIRVLSAGAVEPGLVAAAEAFKKAGGLAVRITYATAPMLRKRVGEGESADVVIAPPAVLDEFAKAGKVARERVVVGRVGVGVAVRAGAPVPDISSTEALKRSILEAESIVFNRASTGLYVERLLGRLGIAEQVQSKSARYPDGASVMEHLLRGKGREVGFGASTEIVLYRDKGLRLVGPLPTEVQNYTSYAASPMTAAPNASGAQSFMRYLATPEAKALFVANGVD
jgi:molybdate transport system substrate-binding protein